MSDSNDVKIGDVGTVYFVPTYDNDIEEANFDPTLAAVKQLIFRMPGVTPLITRTSVAVQKTIGGVVVWGLQYTVVPADIGIYVSGTVGGFHYARGLIKIEAYIEFSSSQKWHSSTLTVDQQGRALQVLPILA